MTDLHATRVSVTPSTRASGLATWLKAAGLAIVFALALRIFIVAPFAIPSASEEPNLFRGDYILVSKWSYGFSRHSIPGSPPLAPGRILFHAPRRGDVVVFKLPADGHTDYVKRLVGLPGDRVQVREGQIFINGAALNRRLQAARTVVQSRGREGDPGAVPARLYRESTPEGRSYLTQALEPGGRANSTGVYRVPARCYFVLGDNRDNSADSRFGSGLAAGDPRLGGCGWDDSLDAAFGDILGVGFVPEDNLVGRARLILLSWNTGVDEWHDDGASLWKPWTWLTQLRPARALRVIR